MCNLEAGAANILPVRTLPYRRARADPELAHATHENFNVQAISGMAQTVRCRSYSMQVLCSVKSVEIALQEVKRVLKPGGKLLFIEHVYAPGNKPLLRLGQTLLNPLQQLLADGCHLTREPTTAMAAAGLSIKHLSRFQVEGESLIAPHVAGIATC